MAVQNDSTLVTKGDLKTLYQNKIRPYLGGGVAVVEVVGTLSAGSTTLVLQDSAITTDSTIDIYTSVYGVSPTDVAVSNGSVTLTFDAQQSALEVKVRISPKKFVSRGGSSERESVSVTADGTETWGDLINRLKNLIDFTKLSDNTILVRVVSSARYIYHVDYWSVNSIKFSGITKNFDGLGTYWTFLTDIFINNLANNSSASEAKYAFTSSSTSVTGTGTLLTNMTVDEGVSLILYY